MIGDLVTWSDDEDSVKMPWWYHNWKDIGVVVDLFDDHTIVVQWCSGNQFPVWVTDVKVLSSFESSNIYNTIP